jgi:hypothetical protein
MAQYFRQLGDLDPGPLTHDPPLRNPFQSVRGVRMLREISENNISQLIFVAPFIP